MPAAPTLARPAPLAAWPALQLAAAPVEPPEAKAMPALPLLVAPLVTTAEPPPPPPSAAGLPELQAGSRGARP